MMDPDRIAAIRARHTRVNTHFGTCGSPQCFCSGPVCSDNLDEPWPCLLIQFADAYEQQACRIAALEANQYNADRRAEQQAREVERLTKQNAEYYARLERAMPDLVAMEHEASALRSDLEAAEARAAAEQQRVKHLTQALTLLTSWAAAINILPAEPNAIVNARAALAAGGAVCSACGQPGLLYHACAQVAYPSAGGAGETETPKAYSLSTVPPSFWANPHCGHCGQKIPPAATPDQEANRE